MTVQLGPRRATGKSDPGRPQQVEPRPQRGIGRRAAGQMDAKCRRPARRRDTAPQSRQLIRGGGLGGGGLGHLMQHGAERAGRAHPPPSGAWTVGKPTKT